MNLHRLAEERSLAYHRAVAKRLQSDPSLLESARARVAGWVSQGAIHPEYAQAWKRILAQSVSEVVAALVDDSEEARALRQVTPFAGFVPARERWALWRAVREVHAPDR